jgi:hypothetical protein
MKAECDNTPVKAADSAAHRDAIFRLEDFITSIHGNGIEESGIKHIHHFAPGVYAKEMIVPADVYITGMVHKTEHISIFLEGRMIVADGAGGSVEIAAPIVEIGKPGIKRAGHTVEQVRWITVHPTDETDIDTLESLLLTNDPQEAQAIVDQQDYLLTPIVGELRKELEALEVHDDEIEGLEIRPSMRHGLGVFATKKILAGDIIAPALIDGKLMCWSRYTNHSSNPNAEPQWMDGSAYIVAIRDIYNEEVVMDYRITLLGEQK